MLAIGYGDIVIVIIEIIILDSSKQYWRYCCNVDYAAHLCDVRLFDEYNGIDVKEFRSDQVGVQNANG